MKIAVALIAAVLLDATKAKLHPHPKPLSCDHIKSVLSARHEQSSATAFCSSYLSIPQATTTLTVDVTSTLPITSGVATITEASSTFDITVPTTTKTVTETSIVTSTTFTSTSTSIISACASPTPPSRKRNVHPRAHPKPNHPHPSPPYFGGSLTGEALSSACSCLSIEPSTVTATTTATDLAVETQTSYVTTTSTSTSVVETSTSTTIMEPFAIKVQGGSHNGNYISTEDYGNGEQSLVDSDVDTFDQANKFTITSSGQLIFVGGAYDGNPVVQPISDPYDDPVVFVANQGDLTSTNSIAVTCSVPQLQADGICPLQCTSGANGGMQSWDCGVYWRLGTFPGYCNAFTPYVVTS